MTSVFISYSRKDRTVADHIAAELRNRGAEVFIDYQKLVAGEDFIGRLGKEIESREYFIIIVSPRSVDSKWVKAEVSWALHNNKTIIPVLLEPASMTEFFFLVSLEQVDFQRWNVDGNVETAILKLAKGMKLPENSIAQNETVPKALVEHPRQLENPETLEKEEADEWDKSPAFARGDISELFLTAAEIADEDPEQSYFLYQQVIEIDPEYMLGKARDFITNETERLKPARIAKMLQQAKQSIKSGDWKRCEQFCEDVLGLDRNHAEAKKLIALSRKNMECQPLYQHAVLASQNGKWRATIRFLQTVKNNCPDYGHPSGPLVNKHLDAEWVGLASELANLENRANINLILFSPDGRLLASSLDGGTIALWSVPDGKLVDSLTGGVTESSAMAFTPDGTLFAFASKNGPVKLWNTSDGKKLTALSGHTKQVTNMAFLSDGKSLVSTAKNGITKVWNVETGKEMFSPFKIYSDIYTVAFPTIVTYMASTDILGNEIKLWNLPDGKKIITLFEKNNNNVEDDDEDDSNDIVKLIFSSNGNRLAAITFGGDVKLWNTPKGKKIVSSISELSDVETLTFSPDGNHLAIQTTGKRIEVWSILEDKNLFTLPLGMTRPLVFSPNGKIFACASSTNGKLWSVPDGKELVTLYVHSKHITSIAFSPTGNLLATASDDQSIKLWGV